MDQEKPTKTIIAFTAAQFWGAMVAIGGFGIMFWSTTLTRLTVLEMKSNNGDSDKGRMENKIDKMSMDFIDLKSNVIVIRAILDAEKPRDNKGF